MRVEEGEMDIENMGNRRGWKERWTYRTWETDEGGRRRDGHREHGKQKRVEEGEMDIENMGNRRGWKKERLT